MIPSVLYGLSASSYVHRPAPGDMGMFDERYGIDDDIEHNLRLS